jgi:NitT/TauT family transport system permease protein
VRQPFFRTIWGEATAWLHRSRPGRWIDVLIMVGLAGLLFGLADVSHEWTGAHQAQIEIDLDSPWTLIRCTFFSLTRGLLAYCLSLAFTLVYGYWAAKDHIAERVLIPLLDILQSIPVLGFMPGLVLGLIAIFPHSNIGLELAVIITIFTGQAWNMTFSFYHSIRSVPLEQQEAATIYRFSWWQRLKWVELPFATLGLVWNSMMSMAGGWFFLMITEAFKLRQNDYRLPGIGSYLSVAFKEWRGDAIIWAMVAMVLMIVALDQLLWRPVVAWAQKFRVEEGGSQETVSSWFLDWLRRSRLLRSISLLLKKWKPAGVSKSRRQAAPVENSPPRSPWAGWVSFVFFALLIGLLAYGGWILFELLEKVTWDDWQTLVGAAFLTLARVLLALALGTLWALPAGLAIGLSPRLAHLLQPVVQILASFPAPMLFPLVVMGLQVFDISLGWGSIVLMLLGTQWYILFNVIAGAMAIPADLREAAVSYRISGWQRFRILYFPAVFPFLVTGWVTAAGGAWNTSIVSEYQTFELPSWMEKMAPAKGLGAQISNAFDQNDFSMLAASVLVMSTIVVLFNRTVWRWCYRLAEERFSLNK